MDEEWLDGMPPDDGPDEQTLRNVERVSQKRLPKPKGYRRTILPARYTTTRCTLGCTVNPRNLPGELGKLVHEWYEEGRTNDEIRVLALRSANFKLSIGGLARHRKNHLEKTWQADQRVYIDDGDGEDVMPDPTIKKKSHIDILEDIIQRGADSLPTGRISAELTIKAMEMHFKMTQGSAVDATIQAIQQAMSSLGADDDSVPVPALSDDIGHEIEAPLEGDISDPAEG